MNVVKEIDNGGSYFLFLDALLYNKQISPNCFFLILLTWQLPIINEIMYCFLLYKLSIQYTICYK